MKSTEKKWFNTLRILFRFRFEAPFTARELYDDYTGELNSLGIRSLSSIDHILRTQIIPYRYRFKIPKNAPRWKPNYYAINPTGIHLLCRRGFIKKRSESLYQEEVRNLMEEFI